jgi:hypothetical protein
MTWTMSPVDGIIAQTRTTSTTDKMDLQLIINGIVFRLGDSENSEALTEAGFRRPNLIARLLRRVRYRAPNCSLSCFDEAFDLYPCTDGYLDLDRQWRTEAELTYAEGRLVGIRFRVIEGRYAAPNYFDRFCELCVERFGDPDPASDAHGALRWQENGKRLICSLDENAINAAFDWGFRR